jgi:SAM-dependent methyltransferase
MACGTGYGAYIVAQRTACRSVLAVDLSIVALYYARRYFSSPKIIYRRGNCLTAPLGPSVFDVAICFETIEHIQDGERLLRRLYESLQPDGRLILSTPNELGMPFTPERFPFHVRHYTPDELTRLVSRSGFKISRVYAQPDNLSKNIVPGWDGNFNIIVCTRTG